jgi:hypothetical protein
LGKSARQASREYAARYGIELERALEDVQSTWNEWQSGLLSPTVPPTGPNGPTETLALSDIPEFSSDYRFCGRTIRVLLTDDVLHNEISPRLAPLQTEPAPRPDVTLQVRASDTAYHIYSDSRFVAAESDVSETRIRLLQEFVRAAKPLANWLAIFHAAACGTADKCVLFPAASQSGKTTLAAALMHAGLIPYTEDTAFLDASDFHVPATPFSLMIREGSWPLLSARFPDFDRLPVYDRAGQKVKFLTPEGLAAGLDSHACAIVFSSWEPGRETTVTSLDHFEALVRLKQSGFWVAHDRLSIEKFLKWLQSLPVYEMIYSDVDEAAAFVQDLLNS